MVETLKLVILKKIIEGPEEESVAVRQAGVPYPLFQQWKREDEVFAAALQQAFQQGTETLASIGLKRAARKSDRLVEFFLKERDPERFNQDGIKQTGTGGMGTWTLAQLEEFLMRKKQEEQLLLKTIEGEAVDVTP